MRPNEVLNEQAMCARVNKIIAGANCYERMRGGVASLKCLPKLFCGEPYDSVVSVIVLEARRPDFKSQ